MCSGATDSTAICVPIVSFSCLHGLDFVGLIPEIGFADDSEAPCMGFGVDLMVEARIVSLVVVHIVNFHNKNPFSRLCEHTYFF